MDGAAASPWGSFSSPLAELSWDALDRLRSDLEQELAALAEQERDGGAEASAAAALSVKVSLGLTALQLIQAVFLRESTQAARRHLATLESQLTSERAELMVEGTAKVKVSLTAANIMDIALRLRSISAAAKASRRLSQVTKCALTMRAVLKPMLPMPPMTPATPVTPVPTGADIRRPLPFHTLLRPRCARLQDQTPKAAHLHYWLAHRPVPS